jgi:mono/diheme cytochrome c family protein
VAEHSHSEARALTGGLVYTGTALPELRGAYLYGDYATGRIWGLRHDGTTVTWHELLADTTLQITGFGTDSHGEILICDHQPREQGGFYRLVPTPAAARNRPPFPRTLSETGLFADVARHRMADGVIPFAPAAPQWSDGAEAVRFLALPPATDAAGRNVPATIGVTNARGWNFPDGTVVLQSFAVDDGGPASRRWIETRLMLKEQGEWSGYSYAWNDEQTDAELVAAEGADREIPLGVPPGPAGPGATADAARTLHWRLPSRTECLVCHSRAGNYVLGLSTVQLNHDFDYEAALGPGHAPANQLRTLEHLGLLEVNWWADQIAALRDRAAAAGIPEPDRQAWVNRRFASADPDAGARARRRSALLSKSPEATNRLVNPLDGEAPLEARARSYLQANCAACHGLAGGGNARIDMEYLTAYEERSLADMQAVGEKPLHATFDLPDARLVARGHAERSVLFARMSRRGPGQMPQLATAIVDEPAVALVRDWILSLPPEETKVSAR